jgi:hypothetical protein
MGIKVVMINLPTVTIGDVIVPVTTVEFLMWNMHKTFQDCGNAILATQAALKIHPFEPTQTDLDRYLESARILNLLDPGFFKYRFKPGPDITVTETGVTGNWLLVNYIQARQNLKDQLPAN